MVVGPGGQVGACAARELLLRPSCMCTARFDAIASRFRLVRLDPLQPGLLPVDEAAGLTPSMGLAIAAHALEVDGMLHPIHAGPIDGVAQLQGELPDPEPLAAELQHLGHERQFLQFAVLVQRRKDLGFAPHLDQLADAQVEDVGSEDGLVSMLVSTSGTKLSDGWFGPHDGLGPPLAVGRRLASVTARRITSAAASGVRDAFIR